MAQERAETADLNDDSEALARRCVEICEDGKAVGVLLFDVRDTSILADFFLICSGNSEPHVRGIRGRLTQDLAREGVRPRVEGEPASRWVVLDYGTVLVHIMDPERRDFYKIEELWDSESLVYRGETPEE